MEERIDEIKELLRGKKFLQLKEYYRYFIYSHKDTTEISSFSQSMSESFRFEMSLQRKPL